MKPRSGARWSRSRASNRSDPPAGFPVIALGESISAMPAQGHSLRFESTTQLRGVVNLAKHSPDSLGLDLRFTNDPTVIVILLANMSGEIRTARPARTTPYAV